MILLAGLVIGFLVVPDAWTVPVVVLALESQGAGCVAHETLPMRCSSSRGK